MQLGDALWTLTQPFFPLPWSPTSADNRMTVLRLRDGTLWVRLAPRHLQYAVVQLAAHRPSAQGIWQCKTTLHSKFVAPQRAHTDS